MGNFTLNIYGENDEILKTYETAHVRWKLFVEAVKINDSMKGKSDAEQMTAVSAFMKSLFIGLTDEELENADAFDIFNLFAMVVNKAKALNVGNGKNA